MRYLTLVLCLVFCQSLFASCKGREYSQFDFWLGKWDVYSKEGALVGNNHIQKAYGGCVLKETYSTPTGFSGESINIYDAKRDIWHQTWVDVGGTLLLLEGSLTDEKMILEGPLTNAKGEQTLQRITWTPQQTGEVIQHWQSSIDDGKSWKDVFYGIYKPTNK